MKNFPLPLPRPGREPTTSHTPRLHTKQEVPHHIHREVGTSHSTHTLFLGGIVLHLCNGYGVWINKTKHSGFDLMLFNRLCESCITSPESWHLSREYITSITSIQYTYIVRPKRHCRPGYVSPGKNTHNRPSAHKGALARGMARSGKAPTSAPPEFPLSPWHTGFRQPPQGPAWPRGNYLHDF